MSVAIRRSTQGITAELSSKPKGKLEESCNASGKDRCGIPVQIPRFFIDSGDGTAVFTIPSTPSTMLKIPQNLNETTF